MTAEVQTNAQFTPIGRESAFVGFLLFPLAASEVIGRGQFATLSRSTGYAALNDGTVPNQIPAGVGYPAVESGTSTVAGSAKTPFWFGYSAGLADSAIVNDGFTIADVGVPFWIADENTPGKLSNYSGSNRSLGGLVVGWDADTSTVTFVSVPVAWQLARIALMADAAIFASVPIVDAAASTTITERVIPTEKLHGQLSAVQFAGAAIAANDTDYVTLTLSKRDGAGGGAVVLATYDSRAANNGAVTAFVPKAFTLSAVAGALDILETDVVTLKEEKGGSGQSVIGAVRAIGKVQ